MTPSSTRASRPVLVIAMLLVAGCSSIGETSNPANSEKLSCGEINSTLGSVSREISRTAVTRGKVANTSIPRWVLGGSRVKTAVADRETARIGRLKRQEEALVAERERKCPRSAD